MQYVGEEACPECGLEGTTEMEYDPETDMDLLVCDCGYQSEY